VCVWGGSKHFDPLLKLDPQLCFRTTIRVKPMTPNYLQYLLQHASTLKSHYEAEYLLKHIKGCALAFAKPRSRFLIFCCFFYMLLFL